MITKWTVSNFKSIREETELEFSPLTIFAGPNSGGKSTFIQSILLEAQTLSNKVESRPVILNGALLSLGEFDDLKSNGSDSDQIKIKFTYIPNIKRIEPSGLFRRAPKKSATRNFPFEEIEEVNCQISFDAVSSISHLDNPQIHPRLLSAELSCFSVSGDQNNKVRTSEISIYRTNKNISDFKESSSFIAHYDLRESLAFSVKLDSDSMNEIKDFEDLRSLKPKGCKLQHFLPARLTCAIDQIEEEANAITNVVLGDRPRLRFGKLKMKRVVIDVLRDIFESDTDIKVKQTSDGRNWWESLFGHEAENLTILDWGRRLHHDRHPMKYRYINLFLGSNYLYESIYKALQTSSPNKQSSLGYASVALPELINQAKIKLEYFFTHSLKYLGPLRDPPKALYPIAPTADRYDVGLRGEHTASILEIHKDKVIEYIPASSFYDSYIDTGTVELKSLAEAVIDWLRYLDVASSVESHDKGKLGHELRVEIAKSDDMHDLTHVGVGVSQVLPILVMCLLADEGSTLILEQPELHLHPKVQTLLGDFFLSMTLCDKQCIVETHSEYLIDRLRFRIAAAEPDNEDEEPLNEKVKIYFVENQSQSSSFREVVINEYGAIQDWPEGFFDQSQQQAEEILRFATRKRQVKRQSKVDKRQEEVAKKTNQRDN